MTELLSNEELIATLQSDGVLDKASPFDPSGFKISRTTKTTCIDFLKDNDVEIVSWINEASENERVKKILRIWFTLFKPYNQEQWVCFPDILDNDMFYPDAQTALLSDAISLGKLKDSLIFSRSLLDKMHR